MTESTRRDFLVAGLALPAAVHSVPFLPQAQKNAAPELGYRTLGKTGLKVTTVGFGCMITSDQSVIEKAADLGINYFDTARGYQNGNNERMVGAALKSKRKEVFISTKTHAATKEQALQDLDTSLKELGTDYVDIWYLHGKDKPAQLTDGLIEALQTAKQAGKARFVGVSTHGGQKEIIPAMASQTKNFDVILTSYNFTMNADLDAAVESAAKAGIGIVAMKVMAGGAKPRFGQANPVLARQGAMLAALRWVINNRNIHTTIPSITDMEQLDENIRAMSGSFSDSDRKTLTAQLRNIRPYYCSMCGTCDGKCPKGMPVADVLRYLTYAQGYGEFQLGRESFLSLPEEIRNIRCGSCETCAIECPNGVRVAQGLRTAQELFA